MIINAYNSTKIKGISFLLILMVLYIHGFYNEAVDSVVASHLQIFLGNGGLANVAVPMFFTISGMLFYNNMTSINQCFPKIKKRIRTLLCPYVIWNLIFILWFIILQNIPIVKNTINSDVVSKVFASSFLESLKYIFVDPANFPLWFLRDLIIMVCISPIIYLYIKYTKIYGIVALLLLTPAIRNISVTFNQFGIAYFALGGWLALFCDLNTLSNKISKKITLFAALIYIGISVVHALMIETNAPILSIIQTIAGMITIWKLYDYLAEKELIISRVRLNSILGYSFFVFLFHEPVFNIIKKVGLFAFGTNEWSLIILIIINPIIMMAIAIAVAKTLQKFMPRIYGFIVGGR